MKQDELNYLKNDRKTKGNKDFITHIDFNVEDGSADIWQYDIFPGIQLLISDFQTGSCFRNTMSQNVISINHCKMGRFECVFDKQNIMYMGEGDIAINSMCYLPKKSTIPLRRFYGSSIILFPDVIGENTFFREIGIDIRRFVEKYHLNSSCHVFRRNEEIEHIYDEIYAHLSNPELGFLKIKIAELLYRFLAEEIRLKENNTYLSKQLTDKIKHVREHLVHSLDKKISLSEVAEEHDLSLTQLKESFKEIYGISPYAYVKRYKMNVAGKELATSDKKISDIALELSYKNPSKFAEAFISVMGCTPSVYRKQHKEKKDFLE